MCVTSLLLQCFVLGNGFTQPTVSSLASQNAPSVDVPSAPTVQPQKGRTTRNSKAKGITVKRETIAEEEETATPHPEFGRLFDMLESEKEENVNLTKKLDKSQKEVCIVNGV